METETAAPVLFVQIRKCHLQNLSQKIALYRLACPSASKTGKEFSYPNLW